MNTPQNNDIRLFSVGERITFSEKLQKYTYGYIFS